MELPTHDECIRIWEEHKVPENVRKHMIAVNKVAVFLAKKLKEAGENVDVELVDRASLLHDLDKISTLHNGKHGDTTKEILTKKGHARIGHLAFMHKFSQVTNLKSWEEKLINYADKRCRNDTIVSLEERFRDARARYPKHVKPETIALEKHFFELEEEIFGRINMKPEELEEHMR